MNATIYLLLACCGIGLLSGRLKKLTYPLVALIIIIYVYHAYNHS